MYKVGDKVVYKKAETLDLMHIGKVSAICRLIDSEVGLKDKIFYHVCYDERCYSDMVFEEDIIRIK